MEKVKNYFLNSKNIFETFAPFYYVLKWFGFGSFNLQGKFSANKLNVIYIVLSFLWYLLFFISSLYWGHQEPAVEKSLLVIHGWHKLHLFEMLFLASVVVWNYLKRCEIQRCLKLINLFDVFVEKKFIWFEEINHKKQRLVIVRFLIASTLFSIMKSILSIRVLCPEQRDFVHYVSYFFYILGTEITALLSFQFIFLTYFVNIRLKIFLRMFEENFQKCESNVMEVCIENYVQLYSHLNSTIKSINSSCSIQVTFHD